MKLNFYKVYHHFFRCKGLGPSCYRGSSALHDDENDALLGGQAQMTDEERFKVGINVNTLPPPEVIKVKIRQNFSS